MGSNMALKREECRGLKWEEGIADGETPLEGATE